MTDDIIYEDKRTKAVLSDKPVASGHILVVPKEKTLIEDLSKDMFVHYMRVASIIATSLFEDLGAKGTNIVINDGNDSRFKHFYIDVIPRSENDGVKLSWEFKQAPPDKLKKIASKIKEETFLIGKQKPKKQQPVVLDKENRSKALKELSEKSVKKDYRIEQLRRIP